MIYYIETNVISIIIALVMFLHIRQNTSRNETSRLIFNAMLITLGIFCLSDIAAYAFRGRSYAGVQIANIIYLLMMSLGIYEWFLYVVVRMELAFSLKKWVLFTGAPALILNILILLNPLTGYFFTVDDALLYHRGSGVPLSWLIEWGYMLAAFALNLRKVLHAGTAYRRHEYSVYLYYIVPMALAAVCQMLFYGTTVTQVGMTIALLLVFINTLGNLVSHDELTGLNNKHALMGFVDSLSSRSAAPQVTIFMLDADHFKFINDTYGHLMGDQALRDFADVLKKVVGAVTANRMTLYRYAGDEFVIVAVNATEAQIEQVKTGIQDQIEKKNRESNEPYELSLSVGCATGIVADGHGFEVLLRSADEDMYRAKGSKTRTS